MLPSARLGGFKILQDVVYISLDHAGKSKDFSTKFLQLLAAQKINLPFLTCGEAGLSIAIQASEARKALTLIEETFGTINCTTVNGALLSLFPHRSNPAITASLLDVLSGESVAPDALARSNSAVSVFLGEEVVGKVTRALFRPFQFSAYRTPADWNLTHAGKKRLYKEVVTSYQEKRPKVYALEWYEGQELLRARLNSGELGALGTAFREFARLGLSLTFLLGRPLKGKKQVEVVFCLPESHERNYTDIITHVSPFAVTYRVVPVAPFCMNGPHFGDRYGIASELFLALKRAQVELLALSCSVASITGVVPNDQIHLAIQAIQGCFDVPSVVKRA